MDVAIATLKLLRRIVREIDEQERLQIRYQAPVLQPGPSVIYRDIICPHPGPVVFRAVFPHMRNWDEFDALVATVVDDPTLYPLFLRLVSPKTSEAVRSGVKHYLEQAVVDLAVSYLKHVWDVPSLIDEVLLDRAIEAFSKSLLANECRVRYLAPLYNVTLSGPHEDAELYSGYRLVYPDDTTWIGLAERSVSLWQGGHALQSHYWMLVLEHERTQPSVVWEDPEEGARVLEEIRRTFEACAVAIRIARGGYAATPDLLPFRREFEFGSGAALLTASPARPATLVKSSPWAGSAASEVQAAAKCAQHIREHFPIAYRRFCTLPLRMEPDDRLIDVSIALENVLLTDLKDELRFRFALRGAWVLHPVDGVMRQNRFHALRDLYDARSSVVHGDESKSKKQNPAALADVGETALVEIMNNISGQGPGPGEKPYDRKCWKEHVEALELGAGPGLSDKPVHGPQATG